MEPFGSLVLADRAFVLLAPMAAPAMPALSLRAIPQDVYDDLKAMAAQNRRSMQEQARLWRERMRQRPMPH
jgi:hypothetical protein